MKGDKRGSHVGVIISFVIFVTFLVFLYALVSPAINSGQNKEALSEHLELEIIERVSSQLITASVNLGSGSQTCVRLNNLINELDIEENIIVKDYSGDVVNSYISSSNLDVDRGSETFLKIYYSPEFDELSSSSGCSEIEYTLGVTKTEEYIFESKILDLIADYEDYENLKDELSLPESVDFGFGISRSNLTVSETMREEVATNIYIKEIPIQYIDGNGNILSGQLKLKIW